jgi:hypothetical protein
MQIEDFVTTPLPDVPPAWAGYFERLRVGRARLTCTLTTPVRGPPRLPMQPVMLISAAPRLQVGFACATLMQAAAEAGINHAEVRCKVSAASGLCDFAYALYAAQHATAPVSRNLALAPTALPLYQGLLPVLATCLHLEAVLGSLPATSALRAFLALLPAAALLARASWAGAFVSRAVAAASSAWAQHAGRSLPSPPAGEPAPAQSAIRLASAPLAAAALASTAGPSTSGAGVAWGPLGSGARGGVAGPSGQTHQSGAGISWSLTAAPSSCSGPGPPIGGLPANAQASAAAHAAAAPQPGLRRAWLMQASRVGGAARGS